MKLNFTRLAKYCFLLNFFLFMTGMAFKEQVTLRPIVQEVYAASPSVISRATGTGNASTLTVTLSGTPANGNLYVVVLQSGSTTTSWTQNAGTTGWTELADSNGLAVYYKQIGTSEPNPTFALSTSDRSAYSVMQITGHESPSTQAPQISTPATGDSSNPDPSSITPTGGSKDYLFLAVAGNTDGKRTFSSAPTNYSNLNTVNSGGGPAGSSVASAERALTATSENPGSFTLSGTSPWAAMTIAIHPPTAPAISISLNTDGAVNFGTIALNTVLDTTASGINDTEVISVDQGPAALNVKATSFSDGSNTWNLATANGSNTVKFEYSRNASTWFTFETADTNYLLVSSANQGSTVNLDLRLTTPTSSANYGPFTSTATITASAP